MINTPRTPEAPRSLASGRRYNEPDVVDTLLRDFLGKCYLCETTISAREHSVDHRKPQALFPELVFTWDNLFPACRDCNERRPAFPTEGLLDPTRDDVESRLHQSLQFDATRNAEVPRFVPVDPIDASAAATARELDHLHNGSSMKAAALRAAISQRVDEVLAALLDFQRHGSATRGPVRAQWEDALRHDFSRRAPFTALVRGRLGAGLEHLFDDPAHPRSGGSSPHTSSSS